MSQKEGSIIPSCALTNTWGTVPEKEHPKAKDTVIIKLALEIEHPWSQFYSNGEYMWVEKDLNNIWRKIPLQLLKPNTSIIQPMNLRRASCFTFFQNIWSTLTRQNFHSVNWFQIQMTELHIALRCYPQECSLTSGIKKGTSSECFPTDEKSTDYTFKRKKNQKHTFVIFYILNG